MRRGHHHKGPKYHLGVNLNDIKCKKWVRYPFKQQSGSTRSWGSALLVSVRRWRRTRAWRSHGTGGAHLAGPLAGLVVELAGGDHHGLAHHLAHLLLGEVLVLLLGRGGPRGRDLALGEGRFRRSRLIVKLQRTGRAGRLKKTPKTKSRRGISHHQLLYLPLH